MDGVLADGGARSTFSFVAIIDEFAGTKDLPPAQRGLHVTLVAVTLLVSWLMTHTTFAFRYAHEYYEVDPAASASSAAWSSPARSGRTTWTSCISPWCSG